MGVFKRKNKDFPSFPLILQGITLLMYTEILSTQALRNVRSVGYGLHCNKSLACALNQHLACVNSVCQCINPETMVYDQRMSSCVVLAHRSCIVDNLVNLPNGNVTNSKITCVKNAVCTENVCVCKEHFVQAMNGSCTPKKVLHETCSFSTDCREDLGLICNKKVCMCDSEKALYSETENGCVGQAEKPCILDLCTSNARCVTDTLMEFEPGFYASEEDSSLSPSMKICACIGGYFPTPSGSCAKDYGILCDEVHTCKEWLRCGEGGTCECLNPMTQFYDENAAICKSRVGGPCNMNNKLNLELKDDICIAGAACAADRSQETNSSSSAKAKTYHCRCKDGYEENNYGGCDLGFGKECDRDGLSIPCHRKGNLECLNGKCGCKQPLYLYDEEKKKCVGRVGAKCLRETGTNISLSSNKNYRGNQSRRYNMGSVFGCIKGATCVSLRKEKKNTRAEEKESIHGICKCTTGKEQSDGSCTQVKPTNKPASAEYIIAVAAVVFVCAVVFTVCYMFLKHRNNLNKA